MTDRRIFPACDGLRAVAAGSVLLFHVATSTGFVARSSLGRYLGQLDVGVDVFFVLSGFLLYRPYARAHLRGERTPDTRRYLTRRFLRIFPAYWVVLTVLVYAFHQAAIRTPADAAYFYGLGQIYSGQHVLGGLVPAWSLCTEMSFYLFLPVYALLMRTTGRSGGNVLRRELVGIGGLYAVSVVFRIALAQSGAHVGQAFLPAYIDVFALGMLLAILSVHAEDAPLTRWRRTVPDATTCWLVAGALFFAVSNMGWPLGLTTPSTGQQLAHHFLAATIGLLVVCPAVFQPAHGRRSLLATPALRWLGAISYGIFLWHLPLIDKAVHWTGKPSAAPFWPVLAVALPTTLVLAWLTYLVVERPLLARAHRQQQPRPSVSLESAAV